MSLYRWLLASQLISLLVACGPTEPATEGHPVSPRREPNSSCLALAPPPPSGPIALESVFGEALDNVALRKAVQLVQHPTRDGVWFVALQDGQVFRFVADEPDSAEEVLDLESQLELRSPESGVVGFALHPDFEDNGFGYVVYSAPSDDPDDRAFFSRLSRFRFDDDEFDMDSERVLLDIRQVNWQHTGNHVAFGPDGYLYYAVGDDRRTDVHAQDPHTLPGSLLRLDVDHEDPERDTAYAIPPDNPFRDTDEGAPEVYAYGLRNPWRFMFDSDSGDLYAGDVGQDTREEIDLIERGSNYGWPIMEGTICFEAESCDASGLTPPLVDAPQPAVRSIVAGPVYHGGEIAELEDRLLYADFVSGGVWSIDPARSEPDARLEVEGTFSVSSFAEARDGSVYLLRYSVDDEPGGVYQVVPNDAEPSDFPKRLSETGCFQKDSPAEPVPALVPYEPIASLWSDGAAKQRLLALPDDGRIAVRSDGDFELPDGTVLVKHFLFDGQMHETRLLMRHEGEWTGYSYRWNEDGSDAELLDGAVDAILPNGVRWHFPSRSECNQCHTEAAGRTLGLEVAQLDHAARIEGEKQNQLRWLLKHDYFVPSVQSLNDDVRRDVEPLVDPFGEASPSERARAYLHVNCSNCHRPDGPGRGDIDLRYTASLRQTDTCDEEPRVSGLWGFEAPAEDQRLIAPGRPEYSVTWLRMSVRGRFGMPTLGSVIPDEAGLELLGQWIESLEGCD